MNKWKPAIVLLLVFMAGSFFGAVVTRVVVRRAIHQMAVRPDMVRERAELMLARRLRLDPMQRRKINQILVESQEQMRQLRLESQPRMLAVTSNAQQQIDALLTVEQRRQFERLKAENRRLLQFVTPSVFPPR